MPGSKRVFDIDVEYCANSGGRLKIIAAIVDPAVITKINSPMAASWGSGAAATIARI